MSPNLKLSNVALSKASVEQATPPKCYSIPETAKLLGIGQATLFVLLRSGKLRKIKILGRTLITAVEIDRFLAEATEAAQ